MLASKRVDATAQTLATLNNGVGCLFLAAYIAGFSRDEIGLMTNAMATSHAAVSYLVVTCIIGTTLSLVGRRLQSLITATAFIVLGCVTKIFVVSFGVIFMGDSSRPMSLIGIALSLGGGLVFAHRSGAAVAHNQEIFILESLQLNPDMASPERESTLVPSEEP